MRSEVGSDVEEAREDIIRNDARKEEEGQGREAEDPKSPPHEVKEP